nr:tyrosine-type recombinase/integrase [Geodermatophilus normandii]
MVEGPTKTGQSRVVDLDAGTVAALRVYRTARGRVSPDLVRDTAVVLSQVDGTHRHPERLSRRFAGQVARVRRALGEDQLPVIRLHDLRHTHATLLLADGVPVKVVSERPGHASATITLTVYQHVHPGMGRQTPTACRPAGGPRRGFECETGSTKAPAGRKAKHPAS